MVTTKLNLSMTEPQVRQIYAKQGDTGRVLDISLDQTPEDGTLRILRPDGVEVTSEAVTGGEISESGETVTFESMTEADVTELTVGIEPIQDLNGYDKPWVGGAGENKLNYDAWKTVDVIRGTAVWENNGVTLTATGDDCYTNYGVTFPSDAKIEVSEGETITLAWDATPTNVGIVIIFPNAQTSGMVVAASNTGLLSYTVASGVTYLTFRFGVANSGVTVSYKNIQVVRGTTVPTFQPYSNICPITGHDEVTVFDDVKLGRLVNFNQLIQNGDFADGTTSWSASGSNTISASGGELSVSIGGAWNNDARQTLNTIADHKYIVLFEAKGDSAITNVSFGQFGLPTNASIGNVTLSTEYQSFAQMMTVAENATTVRFTLGGNGTSYVGKKYYLKNVNLFDLTAMFGSGNEPTVAQFRALFPKDYYAYNVGTEMAVGQANGEPYRAIQTALPQLVYGGTLDMVTGVLTVDKVMVTCDGSSDENWIPGGWSSGRRYLLYLPVEGSGVPNDVIFNYLYTLQSLSEQALWGGKLYNTDRVDTYFPSDISTVPILRDYLSQNNLQICYKLATPTTYQLTAQQIKTLVGTNNVWASSGDIVSIKFSYGGLLSELPSDATSVVGKCYCDVEQNGVSSMPFTLNVKKNERAT